MLVTALLKSDMKQKRAVNNVFKQIIVPSLSLFTSFGTLLCCALPALFVALGMGAALAGLISSAPWLTALSDHKAAVFTVAGTMLILSAFLQWRARKAPCPADPAKAKTCSRLRKVSWSILGCAIVVYAVGFFFAFIAAEIF